MLSSFPLRAIAIALALCLALAACSSSTNPSASESPTSLQADDESATPDPSAAEPDTTATAEPTPTSEEAAETPGADSVDEPAVNTEPLRPATGDPRPTSTPDPKSTSAWISRTSMTSESIGVGWSNDERATEYEIHRVVRTSDDRPPVEAMTAETLIYTTDVEVRFTDEGVEAGTRYWHGVRTLSAGGDLVAFGWHPTAAIDDEQPPIFVEPIVAVAENGEVLITWTEPNENYELHSYRVLRGVNGEPTEQIAVTWDLSTRSFVDDEPPSGQVVYEVVAGDFHWNSSEPNSVTLTL